MTEEKLFELDRQATRSIVRWLVFFGTLIGFPVLYFKYMSLGTVCYADPFFGLQNVLIHLFNGTWTSWSRPAIMLIVGTLGVLILLTLIFGRVFCAWICPYGTLLTFFGGLKKQKKHFPEAFSDTSIKYGVMLGFLVTAAILGRYTFCDVCPAGAMYRFLGPASISFPWLLLIPLMFFVVVMIFAVYYDGRAWCKYFCPLGAFVACVDRASASRIALPADRCIECRRCEKACPMSIKTLDFTRYPLLNDEEVKAVLEDLGKPDLLDKPKKFDKLPEELREVLTRKASSYTIPPGECIKCYQCYDVCPVKPEKKKKKKKTGDDA